MTRILGVVALSDCSFDALVLREELFLSDNCNFPRSIRVTSIALIWTTLQSQEWTVNTIDHIKSTEHAVKTLERTSIQSSDVF